MSSKFDITIVGGGMVGLAMVAALVETGQKILLIEKQSLAESIGSNLLEEQTLTPQDFDVRVSAISPGNRKFLTDLGVWKNIPKQRQANYQTMTVWDGDGSGHIEFSAAKIAQPDLGVIVENKLIQAALLKKIESFGNVQCIFANKVQNIECSNDSVEVILENGDSYTSRLLIGADGAHSDVRIKSGIDSKQSNYEQIAFVANVQTELSHGDTAWQRFTPYGPVAFLPMPQSNLCSVVWTIDEDKAEKIKGVSNEVFAHKLQLAFESKLGEVKLVSDYFGFPLTKRHAERYLSNRIALLGDAAHTIHPLAGQGVNIGFQDVACLAKQIKQLIEQKRDIGMLENLRPYERERKTENLIMQNAMSGFKHLFANQSMPVTIIRNFAMSALDKIPMAKELIIKKAMGL